LSDWLPANRWLICQLSQSIRGGKSGKTRHGLATCVGTFSFMTSSLHAKSGRAARQRLRRGPEHGRIATARLVIARLCVALALAAGLAACGFQLRGTAAYSFASVFVNAPAALPLASELNRAIASGSSARLATTAESAQVVLELPSVLDDKEVLSLTGGGSVREYQLITRIAFRLHDKQGNDWLPPGEIVIRRSYTFNETQVLARDLQEQRLRRDMQTDIVQQLVRRLQAAKGPA